MKSDVPAVVPTPRKLQIRKDVLAQIMSNCGVKKTKWTEEVCVCACV